MKLMICVPTAEFARQAVFYDHFNLMDKPEGTILAFIHGQSPAKSRNIAIEQALEVNCTHILFIDDDVIVPKDIIAKLARHEKEIVTGLYLMRSFPHQPIIFDYADDRGMCGFKYLKEGETGLVPIVSGGLGCCLIETTVFRMIEEPWIRLGELVLDGWCDDIGFFRRVRAKGIKSYCDLEVIAGHMATVTIYPKYIDGKWYTSYDTAGTASVTIPAMTNDKELKYASTRIA